MLATDAVACGNVVQFPGRVGGSGSGAHERLPSQSVAQKGRSPRVRSEGFQVSP